MPSKNISLCNVMEHKSNSVTMAIPVSVTTAASNQKSQNQLNNKNNGQHHQGSHQYLMLSNAMRAYIESLPEKFTITDELSEYQFWKSLRTEFIATFLYIIFTCGIMSISFNQPNYQQKLIDNDFNLFEDNNLDEIQRQNLNSSYSTLISEESQLKNALTIGLTVATLIQSTGHVCGCHLTIAITIGLYVSGRVTPLRLASYLFVQCLASLLGIIIVHNLFGFVVPIGPLSGLNTSQVFGFEFLATMFIVLTYLANCDQHRRDLGFKSLSIGLSYTIGHLFAFIATGASLNPAKALAISIITGKYCLHWIYWISPLIAGLFSGLLYEYIGSIKLPDLSANNGCINCNGGRRTNTGLNTASELRHQFNRKNNNSTNNLPYCTSFSEEFSFSETDDYCCQPAPPPPPPHPPSYPTDEKRVNIVEIANLKRY